MKTLLPSPVSTAVSAAIPTCTIQSLALELPTSLHRNFRRQIIDYYVSKLGSIFCSEQDTQRCTYHVSCNTHYGFCCDIDEAAARKLASMKSITSEDSSASSVANNVETKKLFVTGLSFYTSEKTFCAAFEGFRELVEDHQWLDDNS